jgi:hypothetical protein
MSAFNWLDDYRHGANTIVRRSVNWGRLAALGLNLVAWSLIAALVSIVVLRAR